MSGANLPAGPKPCWGLPTESDRWGRLGGLWGPCPQHSPKGSTGGGSWGQIGGVEGFSGYPSFPGIYLQAERAIGSAHCV